MALRMPERGEPQVERSGPAGPELSIVVPVYKEEKSIVPFLERAEAVLKGLGVSYEILFCLDPSPDRTEAVILDEINRNPAIRLVVFSRRFGQPSATMAGLMLCRGAACACDRRRSAGSAGAHPRDARAPRRGVRSRVREAPLPQR